MRAAQLRGLIRRHAGDDVADRLTTHEFALGAAADAGDRWWVLLAADDDRERNDALADGAGLGAALAWVQRRCGDSATPEVSVISTADPAVLARRAALFDRPIGVFGVVADTLVAAVPAPVPPLQDVADEHRQFSEQIAAAGATPVVQHGVLFGEVCGLEVCRVVDRAGVAQLEVGIGIHDRAANAEMYPDRPVSAALAEAVTAVWRARAVDRRGPVASLAAAQLLRWHAEQRPGEFGFDVVMAAEPPVARRNVSTPVPAVAVGVRGGISSVVVFSGQPDLELFPYAADARLRLQTGIGVGDGADHQWGAGVVVTAGRDRTIDAVFRLNEALVQPFEVSSASPSSLA